MAQYPALPLFTDAYMADTRHLTAAQHGAYLLLLMTAWRMPDCKLPDDDKFLARCVAMDLRSWKANREIVMSFWKRDSEQKWYQARLLDERKYVEDKRSKNVKAAKCRWLNNKDSSNADAMPKSCQSNAPTPTPTPNSNIHTSVQKLQNLNCNDLETWVMQMEMKGSPIQIDISIEIEKMKSHYLAYNGLDKNGNDIFDWVSKAQTWILKAQQEHKNSIGKKNENTTTGYRGIYQNSNKGAALSNDKHQRILEAAARGHARAENPDF